MSLIHQYFKTFTFQFDKGKTSKHLLLKQYVYLNSVNMELKLEANSKYDIVWKKILILVKGNQPVIESPK